MKLDAVRAVEEKWNCKIEWVNLGWDGIIDSINTSVTAGTPDCDIYLTDLQFGISPVANGYVQKISDYAPADSDILTDGTVFTRQNLLGNDDYLFHESTKMCIRDRVIPLRADSVDENRKICAADPYYRTALAESWNRIFDLYRRSADGRQAVSYTHLSRLRVVR